MNPKIAIGIIVFLITIGTAMAWVYPASPYREEINITSLVSTTLTPYTTPIFLPKDTNMNTNYSDILIINGSCTTGTTPLMYEINSYNTTHALIWTKLLNLYPNTKNTLCIYFGNTTSGTNTNKTGTWDTNYLAVYHFESTTDADNDSTANQANLATTITTGHNYTSLLGKAYRFSRVNSSTVVINGTTTTDPATYTVEAWVNLSDYSSGTASYLLYRTFSIRLKQYNSNNMGGTGTIDYDYGGAIPLNTNAYITIIGNATTMRGYINGILQPTIVATNHTLPFANIGGALTGNMTLTEMRLSNNQRSQDYINMTYQVTTNNTLTTIGSPESQNTAPIINTSILTSTDTNNYALYPILGYCNATDAENNNMTFYYQFYYDQNILLTGTYGPINTSQLYNIVNLTNPSTGIYVLECKASDGLLNGTAMNSTNLTIVAYPGGQTGGSSPPPVTPPSIITPPTTSNQTTLPTTNQTNQTIAQIIQEEVKNSNTIQKALTYLDTPLSQKAPFAKNYLIIGILTLIGMALFAGITLFSSIPLDFITKLACTLFISIYATHLLSSLLATI